MKVVFTDTFWKSIKKLSRHNTWWYKTYDLFRYNIPYFLRNIKHFRKELWGYRAWDSVYSAILFKRALQLNGKCIEKYSNETKISKDKKVGKIKRVVELLGNYTNDRYIELAENELGIKLIHGYIFSNEEEPKEVRDNNKLIFDLARKKEEDQWEEIWCIVRGNKIIPKEGEDYYEVQDGTGLKGWWE